MVMNINTKINGIQITPNILILEDVKHRITVTTWTYPCMQIFKYLQKYLKNHANIQNEIFKLPNGRSGHPIIY